MKARSVVKLALQDSAVVY